MAVCPYMDKVTVKVLQNTYNKLGYPFFEKGDYNLNLFGIRNTSDPHSNAFNDLVGLLYKVNGQWVLKKYDATTDPGIISRTKPVNEKGTAILKEGYHKSAFKIGLHKGQYKALVQNVPLEVYRDNDKDTEIDLNYTEKGIFGINLHRSSPTGTSVRVDSWSAGCVVLSNVKNFDELMMICDISAKTYSPKFSFALFLESQLVF